MWIPIYSIYINTNKNEMMAIPKNVVLPAFSLVAVNIQNYVFRIYSTVLEIFDG
jgi:ABC-type dipeptide/oligopeptide/nickel transport system permease component